MPCEILRPCDGTRDTAPYQICQGRGVLGPDLSHKPLLPLKLELVEQLRQPRLVQEYPLPPVSTPYPVSTPKYPYH